MKILHLIDSGGLYGAEMALLALAEAQQAAGLRAEIGVIAPDADTVKPVEAAARERGIATRRIVVAPGIRFGGARRIANAVGSAAPDLLHTHGYKADILGIRSARQAQARPVVATAHGFTHSGRWSRVALYEALDRHVLRQADAVVAVSSALRERLVATGIAGARCHLVHNGLPAQGATQAGTAAMPDLDRVIAFCKAAPTFCGIGRLSREKDFATLLDGFAQAARSAPEIRLLLLGDGELREPLVARASALAIAERVLMPGYLPAEHVLPHVQALVMCSLTEGLPIALFEAMRARVPVITTPVGGIPELLGPEVCARVIAPGRPEELALALHEVAARGPQVLARVQQAYQRFTAEFSASRMERRYAAVYDAACRQFQREGRAAPSLQ